VSASQTVVLGAIAGLTIFVGLPVGRLRNHRFGAKTLLNGVSAGVLLFLVLDIFSHAGDEVERALEAAARGAESWMRFAALGSLYVLGFAVGLLTLIYMSRLGRRRDARVSVGPGAMAVAEFTLARQQALRLGMAIAAAIGLHNFSEGLAIGQSARAGELSLALLLVVGFALHNATEGFGIVGPLAAADVRPPWAWLGLAGLVGGGPTFLGTLVGTRFASDYVFVGFLALAGGAIVYVIGELFAVGRRLSWEKTLWGVAGGFLLGFVTELVLEIAGG
jgi:zinc transporter, ZIP family